MGPSMNRFCLQDGILKRSKYGDLVRYADIKNFRVKIRDRIRLLISKHGWTHKKLLSYIEFCKISEE